MKAPDKGTGYALEEYGVVTVKWGPSPEHPYVGIETGYDPDTGESEIEEIHIEEFKEKRIR